MGDFVQKEQYLGCRVDRNLIGIATAQVQEVFPAQEITPLVGCPDFVLGVVNMRGNIVPVIDYFSVLKKTAELKTIIICNTTNGMVGLLVTGLDDLIVPETTAELSEIPGSLESFREVFISAGEIEGRTYYILNVEKMISLK